MSRPAWVSQPFPPEGASAAEGIRKQLGRPSLDLLTILIREASQNSWDARREDRSGPVEFNVDLRTVSPAHASTWREHLLRNAPMDEHLPLREAMRQPTIRIMTISDRGTTGLGGPTRADDAVTKDRDFVSFVRNIGEPRDTNLGGGTYGFGKSIFYLVSKPGTILVHTRCRVDGDYQTRLIGCALWNSYVAREEGTERRYTGRHWWGDASDEVIEPVIGDDADAVAHHLGLRPFGREETGTSIVVIDPTLEDLTAPEAAEYLAETITWHLWPKMLTSPNGHPWMRFSVTCDGGTYPVPDPRQTRPLNLFVDAYQAIATSGGTSLECRRPRKHLGELGLVKRTAPVPTPTRASQAVGIEGPVHHVCLMRPAELVVTYHPGPNPPSEHLSYAGVFRADPEMDDVYAMAEPPTHDAWNPQSLEYPDSTYVRMTFRRIQEELDGLLELGGGRRGDSAQVALGAASAMFSPLVGGAWGTGGATDYGRPGETRTPTPEPSAGSAATHHDPSSGGRDAPPEFPNPSVPTGAGSRTGDGGAGGRSRATDTPTRHRPRVEYVGDPYVDEQFGHAVLVQRFRLPVAGLQRVGVDLSVALTGVGNRETDPPLGAEHPTLIGWSDGAGTLITDPVYETEGGRDATWQAIVRPAPDTMTEIAVIVEAVRPT